NAGSSSGVLPEQQKEPGTDDVIQIVPSRLESHSGNLCSGYSFFFDDRHFIIDYVPDEFDFTGIQRNSNSGLRNLLQTGKFCVYACIRSDKRFDSNLIL